MTVKLTPPELMSPRQRAHEAASIIATAIGRLNATRPQGRGQSLMVSRIDGETGCFSLTSLIVPTRYRSEVVSPAFRALQTLSIRAGSRHLQPRRHHSAYKHQPTLLTRALLFASTTVYAARFRRARPLRELAGAAWRADRQSLR